MRRAAVTLRKSEKPIFLPLWESCYRPYFDKLIVLDGRVQTTDTDYWAVENFRRDLVNGQLNELHAKYRLIVFTDIDEILVPDPEMYRDLGDYLDRVKHPVVKVTGYHVIEMPGNPGFGEQGRDHCPARYLPGPE